MGTARRFRRSVREVAAALRGAPDDRRRLARRVVHDGLRRAVPYIGTADADGTVLFSGTADRTISRALFTDGAWDRRGLPDALDLAGLDLAGRTMVEVGANIGTTTVQAARLGARVIAFEPEPTNYRLLRANVAVNLLDDRVTCVPAGCSSRGGPARLARSAVNAGDHRVSDDGDVGIDLVRLDDALAGHGIDPRDVALLWLDTQGHEPRVLAGAPDLLAARPVIVTELWPPVLGDAVRELAALLAPYPTVLDLRAGGPTTVEAAARRWADGHTDLLLLPR